jgi:ketosteroid isomerase-like protein
MSFQFSELAKHVAADGAVTPEDIRSLRQLGWGDGKIHREEAEAIFALNRELEQPGPEWVDFFVEALGEFVINGTPPRGHVDDQEAEWLINALDADGRLESMAELELLVRVMERAQNVPEHLKHYALHQIEEAVLTGKGPTRSGGHLSDEYITEAECALVRRIVFSCAGHGPAAVSRHDAEMLFRLKDATLGHDNPPDWKNVFVHGVGNYLMGFTRPNAQLSHKRMRELEDFIADNTGNVARFLGRVANAAPEVHNHFGKVFGKKHAQPDNFDRMVAGEQVTEDEKNWLDSMIEADGQIDELERALLDFLGDEIAQLEG